ncbi:sulfatase [bacterium]|nr:sulfatase [bacterium]
MKSIFINSTLVLTAFTMHSVVAQQKPNILCVVCEDISPYLGCYGDQVAKTPNLDKLATESIRFNRMYTTVGVCAPSRSALITGMYPTSIGANHMRNFAPNANYKALPYGLSSYEVVLPEGVKCYTEFLRAAGYFCTNNSKTDYQFAPPITAWDENGQQAHWKNRPENTPFFAIFNLEVTHESRIWMRSKEPLIVNPESIILPPYFPNDPVVRHDMAVLYSNIHEMDKQVQKLIDEVKDAGLLDNTIIIFYSDNGGPMPRGKRALYESGTLVPFMIRYPDGYHKGDVENKLCSFVDIPATILSLAGIKPPSYMQGQSFMGKYQEPDRQYVYGARNRMDEVIDKMGYIRDAKYRYIRNYMPEKANYMPNGYRLQMPMMRRMIELLEKDSLNEVQKLWFKAPRPVEEFYDTAKDPFEINNIINDPTYRKEIDRLRKAYNSWDTKYNRLWKLPEVETRELFWPGGIQPVMAKPEVKQTAKGLILKSKIKGASFAYRIRCKDGDEKHWKLYTNPIPYKKGDLVSVVAVRAGYKNSDQVDYSVTK